MSQAHVGTVIKALLTDETLRIRFALERLEQVVEPAGAAALAAFLYGRVPVRPDERVCVILSGGNVEITRLNELIAGAAPFPS